MGKKKVGLIGLGRISGLHVLGYKDNPDAEIYAICSRSKETTTKCAKEWGVSLVYNDYGALLKNKDVDAVEILSPHLIHEDMVVEAAKAGKHISCQKPMTMNLASADRMVEVCKKAGVMLKIYDNYVFYPPVAKAKELIKAGVIGDVTNIRIKMVASHYGGWEVPETTWEWRQKETGEGRGQQTFDHGHHLWAVAWHLLGEVTEVKAWVDIIEDYIDSPAVMMWKHREKHRYGQCEYVFSRDLLIPADYYACDEWFEISGSKGIISINRCNGKIKPGPAVTAFTNEGWTAYDVPDDWSEGFVESTRNFTRALAGKEEPYLTGEQGREILALDLAFGISNKENRTVRMSEFGYSNQT